MSGQSQFARPCRDATKDFRYLNIWTDDHDSGSRLNALSN
jgi:hypothetical protein